jgi:hypothetical protein
MQQCKYKLIAEESLTPIIVVCAIFSTLALPKLLQTVLVL